MIAPAPAALSKKIARSDQEISLRPHKRRHSGPCLQQTPRPQGDDDFSCLFSLATSSVNKRVRLAPKTPVAPRHQPAALPAVILPLVSMKPSIYLPVLDDNNSSQQENDFFLFDTATRLKPRRRLTAAAAPKKTPLSSLPSFPALDFLKDDADVKAVDPLEKEWTAAPTPSAVPPVTLVKTLKHSRSSIALCA